MKWKHSYIEESMPGGRSWGTGGIGLADFTGDGFLDVAITRRETKSAYWYRYISDDKWTRHTIAACEYLNDCLGAVAMDVDGDGLNDFVCSYVWFKNPGGLDENPDKPWQAFEYPGHGHDITSADVNGDGRDDIVTYDGHTLAWYDCADNLKEHIICSDRDDHGGVAPNGIGDLTGNGYPDIVLMGKWYENPGAHGGKWKEHEWPCLGVEDPCWGASTRCWLADLDNTGELDIIYSDCDTGWSHVYIVKNLGGGMNWERIRLQDPPGNPETGSFHSLIVEDFDGDGELEIFAGEQEDVSKNASDITLKQMKPDGLKERGVIWKREGATYVPHIIHEGKPGWHDAVAGDINKDGKLEIVSKIWATDGPTYHLDYWTQED